MNNCAISHCKISAKIKKILQFGFRAPNCNFNFIRLKRFAADYCRNHGVGSIFCKAVGVDCRINAGVVGIGKIYVVVTYKNNGSAESHPSSHHISSGRTA